MVERVSLRVLLPHGYFTAWQSLLTCFCFERNLARYKQFEAIYHTYGVFELSEGAILRHHSEEWIKELLSGFHILCCKHLTFTTMNGHTSNGFYYIGSAAK